MLRLIILGILSSFFFSSTWVLNRAMSLAGGHWVWTASLRYGYMLIFLSLYFVFTRRVRTLIEIVKLFRQYWLFWTIAGSAGFGMFYALVSFSASYAAGWVLATTWQTTILATPLVLILFGKRVPSKGILLTMLIFVGIILVNIEHATSAPLAEVLLGGLPVLIAAFAYPLSSQMVWEAEQGSSRFIPHITHSVLRNSFARVLLLTIGSIPVWILLILVTQPPPPSSGQLLNTALVALSSGVIATTIFLQARNLATNSYEIAAVDSTQSTEVIFSLLGEIIFLHGETPGFLGILGIGLTLVSLVAYARLQTVA